MGKKKPKDTELKSQNDAVPAQCGIFNTLFCGAQVEDAAVSSLFSDNNPFRRKPTDPESEGKPDGISPADSDRMRGKERKRNSDSVSSSKNEEDEGAGAGSAAVKRSKKEKIQNTNLDSDANDGSNGMEEENPKLGLESEFDSKLGISAEAGKKKRKRKRDEIEKEYEEKRYGVVSEEEDKEEKNRKKVGEKRKKSDDLADSMVSKEGFDDESKLLRTVFVGNLPLKVKKKLILKEFSKFGEVESVRIRSVPIIDSKKTRKGAIMQKQINESASSVHAYVVFKTEQSAVASLAHNMSLIGGNHIRVDRACPPRKKLKGQSAPLYDPKRTVFVGNLPFDVKDEELYQTFNSIRNLEGSVEAVRVIRDPHVNVGKGIAYVLFKTREGANAVIRKGSLMLRDRQLRLSQTKSDSTPLKRKNPPSSSNAYSPAKKSAGDNIASSAGKLNNKSNQQASLSYQGLRATKSNSSKKSFHQKTPGSAKPKLKSRDKQEKAKERKGKRPAVLARKARANATMESGKKQAGSKRKQDNNRTPESFRQKKKVKRF